jgi:hypothetical protein
MDVSGDRPRGQERRLEMSKLYDFRAALKASIIDADIGWTDETVIIKRQTDLWNDVATAISASRDGAILHIGVARGSKTEDEDLEMDVTVPLTIIALPQVAADSTPEEDLWEALIKHVHDLRLGGDHYQWRLRFQAFEDIEIDADGGAEYLGRQTTFTKRLSI